MYSCILHKNHTLMEFVIYDNNEKIVKNILYGIY